MPTDYELYYGFTRFAIELNELCPELKDVLPRTDARFRPDQRYNTGPSTHKFYLHISASLLQCFPGIQFTCGGPPQINNHNQNSFFYFWCYICSSSSCNIFPSCLQTHRGQAADRCCLVAITTSHTAACAAE